MTQRFHRVAGILLFAGVYFFAGKFGLSLAFVNASASAVWPAAGLALAALLLWGYRLWPGVFIGAFLVNITTQGSMATALGIAAGNTLEALVAAALVFRFAGGLRVFERAQTIFRFVVLAAILSTLVSASFGVASLCLGGQAGWGQFAAVWFTWWLGDMTGILIVTPLLVIWVTEHFRNFKSSQMVEAATLLLAIVLIGTLVFEGLTPIAYLTIPPLLWAAFRFDQRGAITSTFIMSVIALWGTMHQQGPFAANGENESLLLLQAFMGTITIMALVLAALIAERQRAEEAMRESAQRFRQVTESITEVFWMTDPDKNQMLYISPAYEAIWGRSCESLYASPRNWIDAIYSDDHERVLQAALTKQLSGRYDEIYRIVRPDGAVRWIHDRAFPVRNEGGKVSRVVGIAVDITERNQIEGRLRELAAIVENFDDAIISATLAGMIVSWNEAAGRIYGYTAQEAIGCSASILFPPGREHELAEILERNRRGEWTKNLETTRRRKDGTLIDVLLTVSPIRYLTDQVTGASVIARDISLRKRLEQKLLEIGADERRRLGHDLHDGLGQFLLGIALKTKLLEETLTRGKSAEAWRAKEVVGLVNAAIAQTRDLAHGLDPIYVEANGLVAALRNLAAQTRELFQVECVFSCQREHLDVNAQTGIAFYRITQEAIQNAIRHGQARQISVELAVDGFQLCLKVFDNGKGFSSDSKSYSGMGLHIMQFRANSIGGHLTVQSQPNAGARIECAVPAKLWSLKE
jgi:PAS domain S-box-containing protein